MVNELFSTSLSPIITIKGVFICWAFLILLLNLSLERSTFPLSPWDNNFFSKDLQCSNWFSDIGIIENDLVGVKKASTAENGSVVVARLEDEVTLKRFVQENGKIKLVAENKNYDDILIDQNSGFSLEGIAVGVVREDVF